ncbi:redoxin family protein, partial [bacterium]|nr:redoxin family protein [bacterium]
KDTRINADLPQDRFAFVPPPDTKKIASFDELLLKTLPPNPLDGKPAPDFTLSKLDGEEFTLSEEKGKNVVVLDFWATWCPPCQYAMPILEKVMEEYEKKDVKLIAVNQQEDKPTVQNYLNSQGLDATVVLDKNGRVGSQYRVSGIPQFVVIDKQGNIVKVLVGVNNFEENIKRIIDAAL